MNPLEVFQPQTSIPKKMEHIQSFESSVLVQKELWDGARKLSHFEFMGKILRNEFSKEQIARLNMSYLGSKIDKWWFSQKDTHKNPFLGYSLLELIYKNILPEHLKQIQSVGMADHKTAAVFMEYLFSQPDRCLALLVHETMAKIFGLIDVKYPYEDHKELYPSKLGEGAFDWGKGLGMIRPHSDDIYENRDINFMGLTVCRDTSSTPTWFWLLKDVVSCLTDLELGRLALSEATFFSGTNVEGTCLKSTKPILRFDETEGPTLRLDFRIDSRVGPRMQVEDVEVQQILLKMRNGLKSLKPIASNPSCGSVSFLANLKILHGRSELNPVMLYEGESSRILFRSKGIK